MPINTTYLEKKGLEPYDFFLMNLIFQNSTTDMSAYLAMYLTEDHLQRLLAMDLLTMVKAKRKDEHDFKRLRLNKKGKSIRLNASIMDFTENDEKLYDALVKVFESVEKSVGNDLKVKQLLAWFRTETGYSRKKIFIAIRFYVGDLVDKNKQQFIPTLENLIWKGASLFSNKWVLSDSKLYQYIQENKQRLNGYQTR